MVLPVKFQRFNEQHEQQSLFVFDIDETLFRTHAKIGVVKHGKEIKQLTNVEYNKYKLKPGETFDFHQFKSAEIFRRTSTPIAKMLNKLRAILKHAATSNSRVIFVTARGSFDDRDLFFDTFRALGIPTDNIAVEHGEDLGLGSAAKNKRFIFHKYLSTGRYRTVRFYDDSKANLTSFLSLRKKYSNVKFYAFHVTPDGTPRKFDT